MLWLQPAERKRIRGLGHCPSKPEGPQVEEGMDWLSKAAESRSLRGHLWLSKGKNVLAVGATGSMEQVLGKVLSPPPLVLSQCSLESVTCAAQGLAGLAGTMGACWVPRAQSFH